MKHQASCSCGQLKLTYEGEITRTSMCHCFACQQRTGSVFAVQARVEKDKTKIEGKSTQYTRVGDEGSHIDFHFCPKCGSTVYYYNNTKGYENFIIIPVGALTNPNLPAPVFSVYKARKHHWVQIPSSVKDDWD